LTLYRKKKMFICPERGCGKALKSRFGLNRHAKNHQGERPFICDYPGCRKGFLESTTLRRHARIHTGEKPFKCNYIGCGKAFSDGSNYRRHLSIHCEDKPFKTLIDAYGNWRTSECPFYDCSSKMAGLGRNSTLRSHLLTFHKMD